jgi:DOPA 4,5-dioxygenase
MPPLRSLLLAALLAVARLECVGAAPSGGARYRTTHALAEPLDDATGAFPDAQIREWHFHVYFFQRREESVASALRMQARLVRAVERGSLVAVCDGVTARILPALNESEVPPVNLGPVGPHPAGSFETWVPAEHLASALSLFMLHREELSVLIHPLTAHTIEDHTGRAMWLGDPWPIDRTVLSPIGGDPPQYASLGLGYSAPQRRRLADAGEASASAAAGGREQQEQQQEQQERIDVHTFLASQGSENVQIHSLLLDLDRRSGRILPPPTRNATLMDL